MRTTLTLDDDVARLVEDELHRTRTSMKEVINAAIRAALAPRPARTEPFRVTPHRSRLAPGFDLAGFNKLADELEDEAILESMRRAS
ncbi:hypothetical protein KDK95_26350 [Actinospica sp. MGRD01-02]|uniref:Antitoxin n=1 Tax=Actinospica acidithermotolerans TaxID=2828514 RepID=A0A941EIS2_9ACTN|nr:hypothetical protein [Actinospica acidithermotolerans]MBR7829854.1 hypothetical protein [Actinospica acidithermotolerans]